MTILAHLFISYHSDIKCHMTLDTLFCILVFLIVRVMYLMGFMHSSFVHVCIHSFACTKRSNVSLAYTQQAWRSYQLRFISLYKEARGIQVF